MPKISLIIPLYNAEKYLGECLDSVCGQTFKDFECLCINDGSKDKTVEIVKEYAKRDKRFMLLNQGNQGCSVARNTGLDNAQAPYIMFLDQDDLFHPQAMEVLYYLIETHKTDAATFRFKKRVSDDFKMENLTAYDCKAISVEIIENPFKRFFENKKGSQVQVWTRIYRKEAIGGIEFPPGVQPAEDTVFTLKFMYKIKHMAVIPLVLLFNRDSQTSVMNKGITEKYVRSQVKAARVLHSYFIGSRELQGKEFKQMSYYISRIVFKGCISDVLRGVKDKNVRLHLLEIAHSLVEPLFKEKIFLPDTQSVRYFLASKLFLSRRYRLARLFVL